MTSSLNTYPKYKDSGVDWLRDIPSNWDVLPFKKIFRPSDERVENTPSLDLALSISGYRGVEPRNIDSMEGQMPSENIDKYRIVRKGQLAVNTMWLNYAGLGVSNYDGYISPAYRAYNIDRVLDKQFAHHLLRSSRYVQKYSSLLYGLRPNSLQVKNDDFEKIEILVPPLETQKSIASFLDVRTKAIDELIAKKEKLIKLLREKCQSLITQVVTKGLDHKAKMKPSGAEWFDSIPSEWHTDKISSLFSFPNEKVSDVDFEPLSVTYGGVKKQVDDAAKTDHNDNRRRLKVGDIAFNGRSDRKGACGVSDFEGSISVVYHVLRPQRPVFIRYYHHLFRNTLFSQEFYRWGRGIHDDMWTTRELEMKRIFVPVPPLETQKRIAIFLDIEVKKLDLAISMAISQTEQLKEYRSSLIYSAVTGKIKI